MARVLPEIFRSINHEPLASKEVYSIGDALCINVLPGALLEVFSFLEAIGVLDTGLEHLS